MGVLGRKPNAGPGRFARRLSCVALACVLAASNVGPDACAQNSGPTPTVSPKLLEALNKRGDLTLRGADVTLKGALFTIGELWKINIVVGDEVTGTVNGTFQYAPLHEILDAILMANGFSYRPVGDSLVIMPIDQLGQVNPLFVSETIPVRQGNIAEIVESATLLSSPRGKVQAIGSANSIFVLDYPDRVRMIRDFIDRIEGNSSPRILGDTGEAMPTTNAVFCLHHIDAESALNAINVVLSKNGTAASIVKERQLVVVDYPEQLANVRDVILKIDVPRPQVRIHALIYDISIEDMETLGFNWNHAVKARINDDGVPQTIFSIDSITKVPFNPGTTGATMAFGSLSEHFDILAVVRALQTANDARLLADPSVTVLDNERASFASISEIPYQQLTETSNGGQIGTTSFREAGISLNVTPTIAGDGTIQMHVEPEVSRLAGFTPGSEQPIIDTRRTGTWVRVANRQTLVIGGLRQRSDTGNFNGVPGFKDVKVLGNLFRARDTNVRESELIIFIMPEIITPIDNPKPRQMAAAETALCKLNDVPVAEGCPPGGGCGVNAYPADSPAESEYGPSQIESYDAEPEVIPPGSREVVTSPPLSSNSIRRPSRSESSRVAVVPEAPDSRLRPPYDSRYRASGGVYQFDQRMQKSNEHESADTEKPITQEPDAQQAAKPRKKGLWDRLLRF